jgi:hypothetical protein
MLVFFSFTNVQNNHLPRQGEKEKNTLLKAKFRFFVKEIDTFPLKIPQNDDEK